MEGIYSIDKIGQISSNPFSLCSGNICEPIQSRTASSGREVRRVLSGFLLWEDGAFFAPVSIAGVAGRREGLIPGLRREDDTRSMMQAFTLASVDIGSQSKNLNSLEELSVALADCAVGTYAVPKSYNLLRYMATNFAEMLLGVQEPNRNQLAGPIWLGKEDFASEERSAQSKHPYLPVLVSVDNTVIFELPD